jgi:glucose/arabinose dehydrogenase
MGIRNSFGLSFDPITENMWDTENGPQTFDEINLISPKFNSGWETIMGPATQEEIDSLPGFEDFVYSDPEFSWEDTIAPTALLFTDSSSFTDYSDSLFVGACNNGRIYKFDLNQNRDGFVFSNPELSDLVLDIGDDPSEIQWGSGFGCITDMEIGPDESLYIVSVSSGKIYRLFPSDACNLPSLGTWVISESCKLYSDFVSPQGILVQNNSLLTIPNGISLIIPSSQNLTIQFGSGVLIKNGGVLVINS